MPSDQADPLLAVVAPPRVARFRELAGLTEHDPIAVDFSGWSKLVLLTEDRAFLFSRDHTQVHAFEREVEALRTLAPLGLAEVPRVLDVWNAPDVSAYPVIAVSDLAGRVSDQLGLETPARHRLVEALEEARRLPRAVVHGDLHEGQILVDDDLQVTGILDWQTLRLGHPFTEFDLGEWGTGTWRRHRSSFSELRARQWAAYAAARGLEPSLGWCFEAVWSVLHALRWPASVFVGSRSRGRRTKLCGQRIAPWRDRCPSIATYDELRDRACAGA